MPKIKNIYIEELPNLIIFGLNLIVFALLIILRYTVANSVASINIFYSVYSIVSIAASCYYVFSNKKLVSKFYFVEFLVPFVLPLSFFLIQSCGYYYNHFIVPPDLIFYFNFAYCFVFLLISCSLMTFVFSDRFKLTISKNKSALMVFAFLVIGIVAYYIAGFAASSDQHYAVGLLLSVISFLSLLGFSYFSFNREEKRTSNAVNLFVLGFGTCTILYVVYALTVSHLNIELAMDISFLSGAVLNMFFSSYLFPFIQLIYFVYYLFKFADAKTSDKNNILVVKKSEPSGMVDVKANSKILRFFLFVIAATVLVFIILIVTRYVKSGEGTDNITSILFSIFSLLAVAVTYIYIYLNEAIRNKERLVSYLISFAILFILFSVCHALFNPQSLMYFNAAYFLVFEIVVIVLCFVNTKEEKTIQLRSSFFGTSISFLLEVAFVILMLWCLYTNNIFGSGLEQKDVFAFVSMMIVSSIGSLASIFAYFYYLLHSPESKIFKTFSYFLLALSLCVVGSLTVEASLIGLSIERGGMEMFALITFDPLLGLAVVPVSQVCIFIYLFRKYLKERKTAKDPSHSL